MDIIREVTEADLPLKDRQQLVIALTGWMRDGIKDPRIPFNEDVDGDGIVDCFAIDDFDRLVLVRGERLEDTVSVSAGGGVETERFD